MSPQEPTASRAPGAELAFRAGLVAAAALLGLLALPLLRGEVYVADDLGNFHLPMRAFFARCLASGASSAWIPNVFCGFYLQGEGQVGMWHPLHWLLYRLLPLQAAFDLELLLAYPFLIAGTFLFLSRQGIRRDAALLGALVFAFSSFNLLHFVHPNAVAVIAHLPWLLWAIDAAMCAEDPKRARIGKWGVALLTGSQLLLGHPQVFWISMLGEISWLLFLFPRWRSPLRLLALAEGKVFGLLLGAVQILPTMEAVSDSMRSATSESFLQAGSLHYANLLQLLEPYLFTSRVLAPDSLSYNTHEFGFYAGALAPVLVVWLLVRRGGASPRLAIGALALFAIAVLLAAGGWIPPLHHLVMKLPGVGLFRNSARTLVLAEFALAVLAALAFADIASGSVKVGRRATVLVLLLPIASLAIALGMRASGGPRGGWLVWDVVSDARVWFGPALSAAAAALVVLAARGARWALPLMPVLVVADQGFYGMSHLREAPTTTIEAFASSAPRPPVDGEGRAMHIPPTNVPVLDGRLMTNGYAALTPRRRLSEAAGDAEAEVAQAWLRLSGTRWIVENGEAKRVRGALPRARLVTRAAPMRSAKDLASCNPADEALVDEPIDLPPGAPGKATIVDDDPGDVWIETEAGSEQLLVLAESWHRGWTAVVDGARVPLVRAYGDFMGAVVPSGKHSVFFRFEPDSLHHGLALSIAGLIGLGVSVSIGLIRRRPRPTV